MTENVKICHFRINLHASVYDRVMMSHDACTSRTSRVLTVASLQRLKMEAQIPALADCEVQSVIKFLNAQSIAVPGL